MADKDERFANADKDPGIAYELGRRDGAIAEREACAKVVDFAINPEVGGGHYEAGLRAWLAAAIRARGSDALPR